MADQAIPQNVVKKFTDTYETFGEEILAKFGAALLKFPGVIFNLLFLYSTLFVKREKKITSLNV